MTMLRLQQFLPYRLSIVSNRVSDLIAGSYRSLFGLSVAEWRLACVLAERGEATQAELAAATQMDKLTVSRAAIALTQRGLVRRSDHPGDRRSRLLALSATGRKLYAEVAPRALALEADLLADFTPFERDALAAMLVRLETAAAALHHHPQEAPRAAV